MVNNANIQSIIRTGNFLHAANRLYPIILSSLQLTLKALKFFIYYFTEKKKTTKKKTRQTVHKPQTKQRIATNCLFPNNAITMQDRIH